MEKLIEYLIKHLTISEAEVIVAGVFAGCGYSIDALFFPEGIPLLTVTFLSASFGLALSKWLNNRAYFVDRTLKRIDKLVDESRNSSPGLRKFSFPSFSFLRCLTRKENGGKEN